MAEQILQQTPSMSSLAQRARGGARTTLLLARGPRALNIVASAIPLVAAIAATPLLTRGLGPKDYGSWAAVVATLTLIQFLDFGCYISIYRFMAKSVGDGRQLEALQYAVMATITYAIVGPATMLALSAFNSRLSIHQPVFIVALALSILMPASNISLLFYQSVNKYYTQLKTVSIAQAVYLTAIAGLFALHALTLITVLLVQLAQYSIITVVAVGRFYCQPHMADLLPSRQKIKSFFKFSIKLWPSGLSSIAVLQVPIIMASSVLPPQQLGFLALAANISLASRNLPLMSLNPVINRIAAGRQNFGILATRSDRSWLKMLSIYIPTVALAAIIVIPVLGGEPYRRAIWPCILLIAGYGVQLSGAIATAVTKLYGYTAVESGSNAAGAGLHLILLWPALHMFGPIGAGLTLILSQSIAVLGPRLQLRRLVKGNICGYA